MINCKDFLDDTLFLQTNTAKELYFRYAANMPIIDFHCHLDAEQIYKDKPFESLYELWLKYDHYKWRLMRCTKSREKFITGEANEYEKYLTYAKSLQSAINNPLYIWSHLELKKYFGITSPLFEKTAKQIWEQAKNTLQQTQLSPRKCLEMSKVEAVFTTDDVMSDLKFHKLLREENYKVKVLPTFRGDRAIHINKTFLDELKTKYNQDIIDIDDYILLVKKRIDFFSENGAKASDFALEYMPKEIISKDEAEKIFLAFLENKQICPDFKQKLSGYILYRLVEYLYEKKISLQLHIGASRDQNSGMFDRLQKDCGCDAISDKIFIDGLSALLNELKKIDKLPNTIIYNLNPSFNQAIASLCGCFSDSKSNIQLGSAWWFLDNKYGIEQQLQTFSTSLNLSRFVGMLTDSRSFISFCRHDYFRRILCNFIANKIDLGEYYYDKEIVKKMIKDICYYNSLSFFNL
ncbi:MAG: glucuronate isomerase [Bacillota bacterium]